LPRRIGDWARVTVLEVATFAKDDPELSAIVVHR
jgi:hypothetical protein